MIFPSTAAVTSAQRTAAHSCTTRQTTRSYATLKCHDGNGELYNVVFGRDRVLDYMSGY